MDGFEKIMMFLLCLMMTTLAGAGLESLSFLTHWIILNW
jgi:hypothetical protein